MPPLSFVLVASCSAFTAPGEPLVRSFVDATDYLSSYMANDPSGQPPQANQAGQLPQAAAGSMPGSQDASGPVVPFDKQARFICQVRAGGDKRLNMIQASSDNFELMPNAAYALNLGFDQNGLAGRSKIVFEKWDSMVGGKLASEFQKFDSFQGAMADAKQGLVPVQHLGTAGLVSLGEKKFVILTGGTSEKETVVPTGDKYFYHLSKSYDNVLNLLYQSEVRDAVVTPFAIGGQYNGNWAVDKDVLIYYAANMMSYHIGEKGDFKNKTGNLKNVWMHAYDRDSVYAMCKYCQYRTLHSIDELGAGYCKFIRDAVEAARKGAASAAALLVLLALGLW